MSAEADDLGLVSVDVYRRDGKTGDRAPWGSYTARRGDVDAMLGSFGFVRTGEFSLVYPGYECVASLMRA